MKNGNGNNKFSKSIINYNIIVLQKKKLKKSKKLYIENQRLVTLLNSTYKDFIKLIQIKLQFILINIVSFN